MCVCVALPGGSPMAAGKEGGILPGAGAGFKFDLRCLCCGCIYWILRFALASTWNSIWYFSLCTLVTLVVFVCLPLLFYLISFKLLHRMQEGRRRLGREWGWMGAKGVQCVSESTAWAIVRFNWSVATINRNTLLVDKEDDQIRDNWMKMWLLYIVSNVFS